MDINEQFSLNASVGAKQILAGKQMVKMRPI